MQQFDFRRRGGITRLRILRVDGYCFHWRHAVWFCLYVPENGPIYFQLLPDFSAVFLPGRMHHLS